jgi:predicted dehydrogenase
MTQKDGTTRREFLKTAGVTAAGLLAATAAAKSSVYAVQAPRVIGANDRINIGHIGIGGQGMAHVNILKSNKQKNNTESVAVCEVWDKRLNAAKDATENTKCVTYKDYQKLLDSPDVDAVWIATPDHWHAKITIDAINAGKDVYCEKPLCRHIDEVTSLYKTVKGSKRILQIGSQGCSDTTYHVARDVVTAGKLGKLIWVQGSYCRNNPTGEWNWPIDESANETNLDWKMWLGPAPQRPWDPERYFRFRKYWDYSTGILSDLFPHRLHPLMLALGTPEFPSRVACVGGNYVHTKDREVPDTTHVLVDFPSGYSMIIAGTVENEYGLGDVIRGNKATLLLAGGSVELRPERVYADEIEAEKPPVNGPGEDIGVHESNFLDCMRSRKEPNCNIDLAAPVQAVICLAEMAYKQNKQMGFDAKTMQVVQDPKPVQVTA